MTQTTQVIDAARIGTKGYPRYYRALGLDPPMKTVPVDPQSGQPDVSHPPLTEDEIKAVLRSSVDSERDRRTAGNFVFAGKSYQLDADSQAKITSIGADARFAVLAGKAAGDLRWADPDLDFGWIATDNSVTPMDAPTMAGFADAAKVWVTRHVFAARALKDMEPIPADFADDKYWPTAA